MSVDYDQIREYIIGPALDHLGLRSDVADMLVFGTGVQESRYRFIRQLGGGPARGFWQMEPATHADIYANFLAHRTALRAKVMALAAQAPMPLHRQLESNALYAAAMCRVHYFRVKEPLPTSPGDYEGLGRYWRQYYNTPLGKGTVDAFVRNLKEALAS